MINIKVLLMYMLTVLLYNGTPGPVVMLVTSTSIAQTFKRTFNTILGANLGSATLMLVAAFSMLGILNLDINFLEVLKLLGCGYLLYLGTKNILAVRKNFQSSDISNESVLNKSSYGGFKKGYSVGVSNPKDTMFFVSFFPQFMHITPSDSSSLWVMCIVWVVFDLLILSVYAVIAKKAIPSKFENYFVLLASIFILLIAVYGIGEFAINFI